MKEQMKLKIRSLWRLLGAAGPTRLVGLSVIAVGLAFYGPLAVSPARAESHNVSHQSATMKGSAQSTQIRQQNNSRADQNGFSRGYSGRGISLGGMRVGGGAVQMGSDFYVGHGCVRIGSLAVGSCKGSGGGDNSGSGSPPKPPSGSSTNPQTTTPPPPPSGQQYHKDTTTPSQKQYHQGQSTTNGSTPGGGNPGTSSPNVYCPKAHEGGKKAPPYCYYKQPTTHPTAEQTTTPKQSSQKSAWARIPYDELNGVIGWCDAHPAWYKGGPDPDSTKPYTTSKGTYAAPPGGWAAQCHTLWQIVKPSSDHNSSASSEPDQGSSSTSSSTPTTTGATTGSTTPDMNSTMPDDTSGSSPSSGSSAVRAEHAGKSHGGQIKVVCYRDRPMCAVRPAPDRRGG